MLYTRAVDQVGAKNGPLRLGWSVRSGTTSGRTTNAQQQKSVDVIYAYLLVPYVLLAGRGRR